MDQEALKLVIGAIAVIASGLGGQWLAGRNNRLHADAAHEREKEQWSRDLKYQTYLDLIEQFETSHMYLSRASRGDSSAIEPAKKSVNGIKATALRLVGSKAVRELANELDLSVRQWLAVMNTRADLPSEESHALREANLEKFQRLVSQVRVELGSID